MRIKWRQDPKSTWDIKVFHLKNLYKTRKIVGVTICWKTCACNCVSSEQRCIDCSIAKQHSVYAFQRRIERHDSYSGKFRMLRIVPNLSQDSMSSLYEILDGRKIYILIAVLTLFLQKNLGVKEETYDVPTHSCREANWAARHGRSGDQRAHQQAKEALKRRQRRVTNSFLTDLRIKTPTAIGKLTLDGPKIYASTWTP